MRNKKARSGWNLYWVSSDGEEDCFIVARNSRSAARLEVDNCDFEAADLVVYHVKPIPTTILHSWEIKNNGKENIHTWPWYADQWLLRKLGAKFRERINLSEVLIDEIVYTNGSDEAVEPRTIGKRFVEEFRNTKVISRYGHEDKYSPTQMTLLTLLGICIARCQEIENLIANSYIFGALSDSNLDKNRTIKDIICNWERKTLGQMLHLIEETFEIEPTVHAGFRLFLDMRNKLVHGFTTNEQFRLDSSWGQDEAFAFLTFFEFVSRPVRQAFRSSLYTSIDLGNSYFLHDAPENQIKLETNQQKLISLFVSFFKLRR